MTKTNGSTSRLGNRKVREKREDLPDHIHTAKHREPSLLATSKEVLKAMEQRRGNPLLVPSTVKFFGTVKLSVKELMDLRIDTRYQREEVTNEVNTFIVILKRGGMFPDPISVVERKYGDHQRYIVDGQQRWWAHVDTATPILASIYHVHTFEEEVSLFHALNTQSRVSAENRLRSLPGSLGDTIRRLKESESSPLYHKIADKTAGNARISGVILARGLVSAITNTSGVGALDVLSPRFERYYKQHPKMADRFADAFAQLISIVFAEQRLTYTASIAFGRVAYAAWTKSGEPRLPSDSQLNRLSRVDWGGLIPGSGAKWLPIVLEKIHSIWPVKLVEEE